MPSESSPIPANAHILIVEDEPSIAESLEFVLQSESFTTHWEVLAANALHYIRMHKVDLVIMDVGLPDVSGFEACKQLRKFSEVPIIFLTARGEEVDRIVGLEIGADDYVVKPFSPRELAARVKAILKRVMVQCHLSPEPARVESPGSFQLDAMAKTIYFCGQPLALTRLEYTLLETFISRPGCVFSRGQLLDALGIATAAGYDRSIDGHIKTLRAKLRAVNETCDPIKTLRGFGYAYQPE